MPPASRRGGPRRGRPKDVGDVLPSTEYVKALGADDQNRLRVRIWTRSGAVTRFTVQYELVVAGEFVSAVRFDTAHGFAHRDRMDLRGHQVAKEAFADALPLKTVLTMAMGDLMQNWERYRAAFLEDKP